MGAGVGVRDQNCLIICQSIHTSLYMKIDRAACRPCWTASLGHPPQLGLNITHAIFHVSCMQSLPADHDRPRFWAVRPVLGRQAESP